MMSNLKKYILPLIGLLIVLVGIELIASTLGLKKEKFRHHDKYGWSFNPQSFNQFGFRDNEWKKQIKGNRLFILGEGKTSALHLKREDTFHYMLQQKLGMDVLNISVENWSFDQMLIAQIEMNKIFKADYVLFVLTSESLKKSFVNYQLSSWELFKWNLNTKSSLANFIFPNNLSHKFINGSLKPYDQLKLLEKKIEKIKLAADKILFTFLPESKGHNAIEAMIHHFLKEKYPQNYINVYKTFMSFDRPELLTELESSHYTRKSHVIIKNRIRLFFRYLDYDKVVPKSSISNQ